LETNRGNTTRTRNARLAAIQTFFRYVAGREPALAACCSPVLAIPAKKALHPVLGYLSEQELGQLLQVFERRGRVSAANIGDDHQLQYFHACEVNLIVLNFACRLRGTEVKLLPHDFAKTWITF